MRIENWTHDLPNTAGLNALPLRSFRELVDEIGQGFYMTRVLHTRVSNVVSVLCVERQRKKYDKFKFELGFTIFDQSKKI